MQIAVAGLGADAVGLVEQRRGARALPLLPDRLRAVEARLALEVGVRARAPPSAAANADSDSGLRLGSKKTMPRVTHSPRRVGADDGRLGRGQRGGDRSSRSPARSDQASSGASAQTRR